MPSEVRQAIEKSKERLAWFEIRLTDLQIELAGLPSVGYHRSQFLRTQRVIQFVKRALAEEREQLEWLHHEAKEDEDFEKKYLKADEKRHQERRRRELEAERRRERFRVIPGGKA